MSPRTSLASLWIAAVAVTAPTALAGCAPPSRAPTIRTEAAVDPSLPAAWSTTVPDVAELGQVTFVSTVASSLPALHGAPPRMAAFMLGEPLYARIELPLTLDGYTERYGLDDFALRITLQAHGESRSTVCAHSLASHASASVDVALFADARVPAAVDCTKELVSLLSDVATDSAPPSYCVLSVVIEGVSTTTGIRHRFLVHDRIDLGIVSLPDQLEAFALQDRHLKQELLARNETDRVLPTSRMPGLDAPAMVAVRSSKVVGEAAPVRTAITSATWKYATDVRTQRPVNRFVVGVAAMRVGEACELRDVLFAEALDGKGTPSPLTAHALAPSLPGVVIACDRLGPQT